MKFLRWLFTSRYERQREAAMKDYMEWYNANHMATKLEIYEA